MKTRVCLIYFVHDCWFQPDLLELRFSKYRQMSGGRYSSGLKELELSEPVLQTTNLLKKPIDTFCKDLRIEDQEENLLMLFNEESNEILPDFESYMSDEEGAEVAAVISGYIFIIIFNKNKCEVCRNLQQ